MSYTDVDLANATEYAEQRLKLIYINKMYEKMPNITSHMQYSILQANKDDDYYWPNSFQQKAIKVITRIPQKMCEKISCNNLHPEGTCKRSDIARYYRIGQEDKFDVACQPACFHLKDTAIYDAETGEEEPQIMRLDYHEKNRCILVPPAVSWLEIPLIRSKEIFETRLNDLPFGFDRVEDDPYSYSGRRYDYNEMYCASYYDQWDAESRECVVKWYEKILYAVVGESIIKSITQGIQLLKSGGRSIYPDPGLPDPPYIDAKYLLDNWKSDIDNNFVIPDVDYELSPTSMQEPYFHVLEECAREKKLKFVKKIQKQNKSISINARDKLDENIKNKLHKSFDDTIYTKHDGTIEEFTPEKDYSKGAFQILFMSKETNEEGSGFGKTMEQIVLGLLEAMTTGSFWADVGIAVMSDIALDKIKLFATKAFDKMIPKLTQNILKSTTKYFTKVLSKSIFNTLAKTASKVIIKATSRVLLGMAKLAAEAASVVGIILMVVTIFDLILMFWDPLGFNNKFDKSILTSLMRQSDQALRTSMEVQVPEMTFEMFTNFILTDDEILNISLQSFVYMYEYLDALTVNSQGSRIDKGDEILLNPEEKTDVDNNTVAKGKIYTSKQFYDYEINHSIRMSYFKESQKIAFILIGVGSLLLFINSYFIGLIVIFIAIIILFTKYINTTFINMGIYKNELFQLTKKEFYNNLL